MDVSFAMFKSDGSRHDFPMRKERVLIGRKDTCDLRVPLSAVSREHCEVFREGGELHLRDLGSSNGTFRNGVRVQETTLEPGDQIVIGPVTFTVVINGEPAQVQPGTRLARTGASDSSQKTASAKVQKKPEPDLDDSDDLSALLAEFDDEDDSFAGLEVSDDEDEEK